jgi:hypothetical protein
MVRPLNSHQILDLVDKRFKLEQNLAFDLVAEFDRESNGLIGPLKQMAKRALDDMHQEPQDVIDKACYDENLLTIWGTRGTLQEITNQWQSLTAQECSDVIRLYGAAVEKRTEHQRENGSIGANQKAQLHTLKQQYRPGGNPIWEDGRIRKKPGPGEIPAWHEQWQMPGVAHGIDIRQAAAMEKRTNIPLPPREPGQQRFFTPTMTSTVKKIDKAFGLPVGADISGTTGDSIFFIERLARLCNIPYDPLYQLLALATLVAARHHAVLESALTLTLNNIITYKIGFYKSLLPSDSRHQAKSAIDSVLSEHDNHDWNAHILVYFDQPERVVGGYLFFGGEIDGFKKLATTSQDFMWLFSTMPPYPTKVRIDRLMRMKGLL